MADKFAVTKCDMDMLRSVLSYPEAGKIPLAYKIGDIQYYGIPCSFSVSVQKKLLTSNTVQIIITGKNPDGLKITAENFIYRDFPVSEWVAYFENEGEKNTPVISDIRIIGEIGFSGENMLIYGNGDNCNESGYEFFTHKIEKSAKTLAPSDGTPCNGAFPYMRIMGEHAGINIAVGWPAQWQAEISKGEQGTLFSAGQQRCNFYIKPGEILRTPKVTFMGFCGGEEKGRNLWRRWYLKHILPRENGQPLPPKLCLHLFQQDGYPEFTGATEEKQLLALETYIQKGMKPDIWWIDAGWYPCDFDWPRTGTWRHNEKHFPHGLAPIGEKCDENDVKFLLWFEPERVRAGTDLDTQHPQWCLSRKDGGGDRLLNLGDKSACDWLIDHVDSLIKAYHVGVYRQDFNFAPLPIWMDNEESNRVGALENLHVQGYLRYWDELILRNPGLWIDSCASGGRRNELETMRRAVPLHYTDVGYGNHPIKQKQHREMFEWIPYFRAHTLNWDNDEGFYTGGGKPMDRYACHCALTPALTSMVQYNDNDEMFAMGNEMTAIWRRAADIMLTGDYYPLTECRKDPSDWYAMQFDDPTRKIGFVQVIRNTRTPTDHYTAKLVLCENAVYTFENMETGETFAQKTAELSDGLTVSLPLRSGVVYFYRYS